MALLELRARLHLNLLEFKDILKYVAIQAAEGCEAYGGEKAVR